MLRIKSMSTLFFAESIHHNVVTSITEVVMELMILQELKAGDMTWLRMSANVGIKTDLRTAV